MEKMNYEEIAIIGMAARFSHADNIDELWDNLRVGKDCVTDCPEGRKKDIEDYLKYLNLDKKDIVYRKAAYLKEIDKFDFEFFRIPPNEAKIMDPNQRILLETSYNAIEDSGYSTEYFNNKKVGCYTGCPAEYTSKSYQNLLIDISPELADNSFAGNLAAMLPARLSYFLNLHGPAILIDTACSSSLVAIHLACKSIQSGECEMALASGINLFTFPVSNTIVNAIGIVASDGKARTFDDSCDGVGQGEGAGAVLLKPLKQALKDNDHIYAVIKSSASNQDGKSIGITAPSAAAQEKVLVDVWKKAEIDPETIGYIEAHGTATKLGDPTEISGINRAFKNFTTKKGFCGVGSIKSNIGHTIGAAGVASVIKVALALENKELPPSIHFEQPNRKINFINSAVYVNGKLKKWESPYPRCCGVSSFGISGTNCHILLEEAPKNSYVTDEKKKSDSRSEQLFTLSAKSKDSMRQLIKNYIRFIKRNRNADINDICYTANTGRTDFNYRLAVTADSKETLRRKLEKLENTVLNSETLADIGVWMSVNMLENGEEKINEKEIGIDTESLKLLAVKYVNGEKIDWDNIYHGGEGHKISIPVYSFKKNRCWFDIPDHAPVSAKNPIGYYEPSWVKNILSKNETQENLVENVICFSCGDIFTENLIALLKEKNINVFRITFGKTTKQTDRYNYVIRDTEECFDSLFHEFEKMKNVHIIFSSLYSDDNLEPDKEIDTRLQCGIYRFLRLIKSLANIVNRSTRITLLTNYAYAVSGNESQIRPDNAGIIGLAKTLQWEVPLMNTRCVDIDENTSVESVLNEMFTKSKEYLVCYRNHERFVERIRKADLISREKPEKSIRPNGVYVLVGGLGRIGSRLSNIFSESGANVVFVGRTELPSHDKWKEFCANEKSTELSAKVDACLKLEKLGCKVHYYSCDVSDYESTVSLLENIRTQVGPINGIIQFAVDDLSEKIVDLSEDEFKKSMRPKIYGTNFLNQLTQKDDMDFFVMFSSVMTLVSGNGVSSYVTSNTYLESYAEYMRKQNRPATVISWPEWMGIVLEESLMYSEETSIFRKMPFEVGYQAIQQILSTDINRVIVGEINTESKIYNLLDYLPFNFSEDIRNELFVNNKQKAVENNHITENVKIKGRKTSIYSDIEKKLAQSYFSIMGYDEVDISSNFFEIGGDSISAVKICVELEKFNIELTPIELLKYQTIESIASYIEKKKEEVE